MRVEENEEKDACIPSHLGGLGFLVECGYCLLERLDPDDGNNIRHRGMGVVGEGSVEMNGGLRDGIPGRDLEGNGRVEGDVCTLEDNIQRDLAGRQILGMNDCRRDDNMRMELVEDKIDEMSAYTR